jgi:hypothetical protein
MGYLILFQASTWFTELITSEKYPQYALYQQRVGKFLPKTKTVSMEEPETEKEKERRRRLGVRRCMSRAAMRRAR